MSHTHGRASLRWWICDKYVIWGYLWGQYHPRSEDRIGMWSFEAFERAMREGVSRDGSHLFPAFPYYAFTKLSDEDVRALYTYLMTRPAVGAPALANTLPFPLSIRAFQEPWKILSFQKRTVPSRSIQERRM
jgi:hypothetical protein